LGKREGGNKGVHKLKKELNNLHAIKYYSSNQRKHNEIRWISSLHIEFKWKMLMVEKHLEYLEADEN
jgi:hypothetical protein